VGTDVREWVLDGGDAGGSNKVVAVDLRQDFIDLGETLFKGPTKGIEFRVANLLDSSDHTLDDVKGSFSVLYTGAVFHLFQEDEQKIFAEQIAGLLKVEGQAVAFGLHRGAKKKGFRQTPWRGVPFCHDPESWKEMWREVLGNDAKNWEMKVTLRQTWTNAEYVDEEHPVLQWSLMEKIDRYRRIHAMISIVSGLRTFRVAPRWGRCRATAKWLVPDAKCHAKPMRYRIRSVLKMSYQSSVLFLYYVSKTLP
jgi:hypothetical protein